MLLKGEFETAKKFEVLAADEPEELEDIDLGEFDANDFEIPEELATPPDDNEAPVPEVIEEKGGKSPDKKASQTAGHSQIPKFGEPAKDVPENPEEELAVVEKEVLDIPEEAIAELDEPEVMEIDSKPQQPEPKEVEPV